MPSPFDEFDAAMQADIDALFGEGVRIIPQSGDQYTKGVDALRPMRENVRATIARAPKVARTDYSGTSTHGAPVSHMMSEAWIDRAAYAALGYALQRGDLLEIPGVASTERFTIMDVRPSDGGDVQIILG